MHRLQSCIFLFAFKATTKYDEHDAVVVKPILPTGCQELDQKKDLSDSMALSMPFQT
jgi:hypothetical protein